jgi:hypothetical protein
MEVMFFSITFGVFVSVSQTQIHDIQPYSHARKQMESFHNMLPVISMQVVMKGYTFIGKPKNHGRSSVVVIRTEKPKIIEESRSIAVDGVNLKQTIDEAARTAELENLEREINRPKIDNFDCLLPPDTGNGHHFIPSVFFNSQSFNCEVFAYSGEGGNANRFDNFAQCMTVCVDVDHDKDPKQLLKGKMNKFIRDNGTTKKGKSTTEKGEKTTIATAKPSTAGEITRKAPAKKGKELKPSMDGELKSESPDDVYEDVIEYVDN